MGHRLGDLGVEGPTLEIECLEAEPLEFAEHLAEQRTDLFGMVEVGGLRSIEYWQQRRGELPGRPIGLGPRLGGRTLPEVVEVGLDPLRELRVLVAFGHDGEHVDLGEVFRARDRVGDIVDLAGSFGRVIVGGEV